LGVPAVTERERRAYNRGLETAAKLAKLWSDENFRMSHDTILCDPILNGSAHQATLARDVLKSESLAVAGHAHASIGHACKDLARMIREQKVS